MRPQFPFAAPSKSIIRWIFVWWCALGCSFVMAQDLAFDGDWKQKTDAVRLFEIRGTRARANPLRRKLKEPFCADELFVHFRIRYPKEHIDSPSLKGNQKGDGEFVVLWLDEREGAENATHNGGIPNIGVHVKGGQNRFMTRFSVATQSFTSTELEGDKTHWVVARLWKEVPGTQQPFNRVSIWVDPDLSQEQKPHAKASVDKAISKVQWIGFSTGAKTETSDRIQVSEAVLSPSWYGVFGLVVPSKPSATAALLDTAQSISFQDQVYPLLKKRCFECHAGKDPEGEIRLDVWDEALNQVAPFKASESKLLKLIKSQDPDKRMPPVDSGPRLNDEQIKVLATWVEEGASWDEMLLPTPIPQSKHWSFQRVVRPKVPPIRDRWIRNPIDAFIKRKQLVRGTHPVEVASYSTLVRRISLDLTGLPPAPETRVTNENELQDFISNLLQSKSYGERWGRHWLDIARYAESNGHQHNRGRPHAWRYRDYVISSFQSDKPFDQFVREQVGGVTKPTDESIVATGFLAAARYSGNELDKEIQRNDILVDVTNTTAKAFLGLTMECAQCHTHKFDPISIRDYYRFQAFFADGQPNHVILGDLGEESRRLIQLRWDLFSSVQNRLVEARRKRGIANPIVIPKSVIAGMNGRERDTFRKLETQIAKLPVTWAWFAPRNANSINNTAPHEMRFPLPVNVPELARAETYIRLRGDVKSRGPRVEHGIPLVFGTTRPQDNKQSRQELLADWLTLEDNPLTARVWVNRIWQWHFGRGLVKTSGDFGTQGSAPSHPELLDWLATELVANDWSTRHIHELILNSNTYRQSSGFKRVHFDLDPDCDTYWRWVPRRLEAEAIRDSVLLVAGELDPTVGGPSIPLAQRGTSPRRSVYLFQKRDKRTEQQVIFDQPNGVASCSRRRVSTVPLQPLYLLNSDFMQAMAVKVAERVRGETSSDEEMTKRAFQVVIYRQPTPAEQKKMIEFLQHDGKFEDLCLALLNLNEFLYIP